MAYILKANGTRVDNVKGGGPDGQFTLSQLQKAVGGFIWPVPGTLNRAFSQRDDPKRRPPINRAASAQFNQQLVGDVIVLEDSDT